MATTVSNLASNSDRVSWILDAWKDLLLFIATPALIIPLLMAANLRFSDQTIYTMVIALGATGHHLPGMMRAYGDRDLFRRFRVRFIAAPLLLLVVCVWLSLTGLTAMRVVLLLWGFWHGLMQVYGFVRIYDAKVGSFANSTAKLDWWMCFSWFSLGLITSQGRMSNLLEVFYQAGGPLISPGLVNGFRLAWGIGTIGVTVAFLVNHVIQVRRGTPPSGIKLVLMATSFAFWWYAMVWIDSVLIGIALFEIFHDVQYLAIVWIFNRRRVDKSGNVGSFTRFLFRRNAIMMLLYVGLVLAYGLSSLTGDLLDNQLLFHTVNGFFWMSTLLHFYFDGFIWKVREQSTRDGLDVDSQSATNVRSNFSVGFMHLLKWTPFALAVGLFSFSEWWSSAVEDTASKIRRYENIVQIAPDHEKSAVQLASLQQNAGLSEEAKTTLEGVIAKSPEYVEAHVMLASVFETQGLRDKAITAYERAIKLQPGLSELTERVQQLKNGAPTRSLAPQP